MIFRSPLAPSLPQRRHHAHPTVQRTTLRIPARVCSGRAVACLTGAAQAQEVGGGSKGAVTGAAGGATSEGANSSLERCDQALGTIGVVEDQNAGWYRTLQSYKLGSTVPVLRMMIQQSNCFVVVERARRCTT